MKPRSTTLVLILVLSTIIGSFFATSMLVQHVSSRVDVLSSRIANNSAPSIRLLASVRGGALHVERAIHREILGGRKGEAKVASQELSHVARDLHAYEELTPLPGEEPARREVVAAADRFQELTRRMLALIDLGKNDRARTLLHEFDGATDGLVRSAMRAIELNARESELLAAEIHRTREHTVLLANVLTAICVTLGVVGAALLLRQTARHRDLMEEHARSLGERADELDAFAGRVAHDIRNPLAAASLAVDLMRLRVGNRQDVLPVVERLERSLARTEAIINDLLSFARAGAPPDGTGAVEIDAVIRDVRDEYDKMAARAGVTLEWRPVPPVAAACSEGVYLSLLGNLVRNAIRHMGDSPKRVVEVEVTVHDDTLRTEVRDTGPGVAPELIPFLFEPYFRGEPARDREGLGLGLPTVRRLAEGHGGAVGLETEPGRGSTFWFEIPVADRDMPITEIDDLTA